MRDGEFLCFSKNKCRAAREVQSATFLFGSFFFRLCERKSTVISSPLSTKVANKHKTEKIMAKVDLTMDLNLKAYPNDLTPDIDSDSVVKVDTQTQSLTLDDLAEMAAARIGCEESLARSVAQVAMEEAARAVASGFCVSTPLCYVQPMASGVLMEEELSQPVDREQVKVYGSFRQGPALKEAMEKARLKLYLQPASTGPYIAGMVSAMQASAAKGETVPMLPGEMVVINGQRLKVVGDDPTVGVTLTSVSEPSTSVTIPASKISPNMPKKLQFVLPSTVTEGEWRVKVTTQYSGTSSYQTKQARSFELSHPVYIGTPPDAGGGEDGEEEGGSPDPME